MEKNSNKNYAEKIAKRLVDYLNSKGIKAESDFHFGPIEKILRNCYYVKKLKDCGHTDCIHVGLPDAGSFFAVLENGSLMSGFHVMIQDAIYCIGVEYLDELADAMEYPKLDKSFVDDFGDCGMMIVDFNKFKDWLDKKMPLSVGMKVRWIDPNPKHRDLSRIYTIDRISGEIYTISDDFSEAEVFASELEIVD